MAYGGNELSGLYIMFKLPRGEDRTGTDEGWIYATFAHAPTGWTPTASGRIASCMECHVDADGEGGRLFGLAPVYEPR